MAGLRAGRPASRNLLRMVRGEVEKGVHGATGNKCIFLPQKPSTNPLVCLAWAAAARLSAKAVSGMVSSFPLLNRPRMATDGGSDVFDGTTAGEVRLQLSFLSLVQPPDVLGVSFRVNVGVNISFAPLALWLSSRRMKLHPCRFASISLL